MNARRLGSLAAGVLVLSWLVLAARVSRTPFHGDEGSWIAAGVYYMALLQRGDFRRDEWACERCGPWGSLNPQLGKLLIGAPAKLRADASGKPYTLQFYHFENSLETNEQEGRVPPLAMLRTSRLTSAAFGAACCAAVFLLTVTHFGSVPAAIAVALLLTNPTFTDAATRAMSDAHYLAFLLVAYLVGDRATRPGASLRTSVLGGVAAGLACSVKITGIVIVGGFFGVLLVARLTVDRDGIARAVKRSAAFSLSALLTVYALNPIYWATPLDFPALFGRWNDYMTHQRDTGFGLWHGPRLLEIPVHLAQLTSSFPLEWALALVGISAAVHRERREQGSGIALLAALLVNVALIVGFLPLNWDRYYLPAIVLMQPFAAIGVVIVGEAALCRLAGARSA